MPNFINRQPWLPDLFQATDLRVPMVGNYLQVGVVERKIDTVGRVPVSNMVFRRSENADGVSNHIDVTLGPEGSQVRGFQFGPQTFNVEGGIHRIFATGGPSGSHVYTLASPNSNWQPVSGEFLSHTDGDTRVGDWSEMVYEGSRILANKAFTRLPQIT